MRVLKSTIRQQNTSVSLAKSSSALKQISYSAKKEKFGPYLCQLKSNGERLPILRMTCTAYRVLLTLKSIHF